jgi:quinol monooxygenase YgiN
MTTATHTLTVAFVVKLVAKEEKADEVGAFLASAVALANEEPGTLAWFALRTDATTFWIVDAFASQADRQAHIEGPIAAALMANAERLLAMPPEVLPADVLAAKVPDGR